jgi:hypothetical protein
MKFSPRSCSANNAAEKTARRLLYLYRNACAKPYNQIKPYLLPIN